MRRCYLYRSFLLYFLKKHCVFCAVSFTAVTANVAGQNPAYHARRAIPCPIEEEARDCLFCTCGRDLYQNNSIFLASNVGNVNMKITLGLCFLIRINSFFVDVFVRQYLLIGKQ
jgi:hypothetical protein